MEFVIFSMGRTAVQWLGNAFNCHPRVILWGGSNPFPSLENPADWDGYFKEAKATDFLHSRWMRPGKKPQHFGNLHGLEPSRYLAGELTGQYRCVQLTREPFSRIASIRARVLRSDYARFPERYENAVEQIRQSLESVGVTYRTDTPESRLLIYACGHLVPHDSVYLRSTLHTYRYEDMFNEGVLDDMIDRLCDDVWPASAKAKAMAIDPIDASAKQTLTEEEVDFVQRAIDAFSMREVYQGLGYLKDNRPGVEVDTAVDPVPASPVLAETAGEHR